VGTVQFYDGKVLFVGGQVAMHEDCCCEKEPVPDYNCMDWDKTSQVATVVRSGECDSGCLVPASVEVIYSAYAWGQCPDPYDEWAWCRTLLEKTIVEGEKIQVTNLYILHHEWSGRVLAWISGISWDAEKGYYRDSWFGGNWVGPEHCPGGADMEINPKDITWDVSWNPDTGLYSGSFVLAGLPPPANDPQAWDCTGCQASIDLS